MQVVVDRQKAGELGVCSWASWQSAITAGRYLVKKQVFTKLDGEDYNINVRFNENFTV